MALRTSSMTGVVDAKASPSGEDLNYTFDKVSGDSVADFLEIFEGNEASLVEFLGKALTARNKSTARQSAVQKSVPQDERAIQSAAKKLVKGGVFSSLDQAIAVIRANRAA